MSEQKKQIRKEFLDKRALLREEEIKEKSIKITEKLLDLKEFNQCSSVMCYIDFKNEPATRDFIRTCLNKNIRVSVPVIINTVGRLKKIIASEILSIDNDLKQNSFGILEPLAEKIKEVEPCVIDLIIVPGLAFDVQKNRLGYGAGFYDRFLENTRADCTKIGVAFDFQIINSVPIEEYDKKMSSIITENRIIL